MKKFDSIDLNYSACRKEVEEFRALLAGKEELSERNDVLKFFRDRPQMATLFGWCNRNIVRVNRIAWEFDIFGDFACDLVVGDWERRAYCFVEFEDARADSIFRQMGKKATREWGQRFEHGCSQIIDWLHKLDGRIGVDLLQRFGDYEINFEAVLVIGRDGHLNEGEQQRLAWRSDKLAINSKKISCMTFDGLLNDFAGHLERIQAYADTAAVSGVGVTGFQCK